MTRIPAVVTLHCLNTPFWSEQAPQIGQPAFIRGPNTLPLTRTAQNKVCRPVTHLDGVHVELNLHVARDRSRRCATMMWNMNPTAPGPRRCERTPRSTQWSFKLREAQLSTTIGACYWRSFSFSPPPDPESGHPKPWTLDFCSASTDFREKCSKTLVRRMP